MKKYYLPLLILCLSQLLNACSRAPAHNTHVSHKQAHAQNQKQQSKHNSQNRTRYKHKKAPIIAPQSQVSQQTRSSVITNNSIHPSRNLIVNIAKSTIGAPYKWGGNTPRTGFDCSGLMSYVHKNALGIKIPRTAAKQRDTSRTINYAQLQPGDMLFFKTGKRSNHVGVYIGDRKFIHAATGSKHVRVASMDSSYWHKRFVKFGTFL